MKTKILLTLALALSQWGCQSLKKEESTLSTSTPSASLIGQWEAKALIKDASSGKSHVVNLDVLAQKNNLMRMEVSTTLGISLASVLIEKETIQYLLPREKKYFSGKFNNESLRPILRVSLDPRLLTAVFFEESYPEWTCRADHGLLSECQLAEGTKINWIREDTSKKKIVIAAPEFEIQVQLNRFQEKKELPKAAGALKVPESYKQMQL